MTAPAKPPARSPFAGAPPDPGYGIRFRRCLGPDGQEVLEQIPMTLEDLLHPEEGDEINMRPQHLKECTYLLNVIGRHYRPEQGYVVASDWRIDWGVPPIRPHQPDLVVFAGVREPPDPRAGTFVVRGSGGRCLLVIENVSLDSRNNDVVEKFHEYYQVGVPFYVLIDQEQEDGPRCLVGYRHTPKAYRKVALDKRGWLPLKPLALSLGLKDDAVVLYDSVTGEEQRTYDQAEQALLTAEETIRQEIAARQAVEQRLRELEAENRRLRQQRRK